MFYIWLLIIFVFPSILALDEMRRRANRYDILCCASGTKPGTASAGILSSFVEKVYAPTITHPGGIVFSLILATVLIAVSAMGIGDVQLDLQVIDVLDTKDVMRPAVEERFAKFGAYGWKLFGKNLDLTTPDMQLRFLAAYERVQSVDYVQK